MLRVVACLVLVLGAVETVQAEPRLLIFGGTNNRQFLGCLNCDKYDSNSVFNPYADFGSRYSDTSILNPYGDYGSKYSDTGACNPYANSAPVIVDDAGNYYGRLTMNRYADQTSLQKLVAWLGGVCAGR